MRWTETSSPYRREPSYGTGSVVVERKGYNVRTRGDTSGTIEHEYECPVHGRFKAMVPRVDVPDARQCPTASGHTLSRDGEWSSTFCTSVARWVPPLVGVGRSSGEVTG
jgi:hypothetical protein